ncbi:hypothetical protein [Burkholderia phage FLC9]|nr:hypothetical protein [Burkholderia phage FLC9]
MSEEKGEWQMSSNGFLSWGEEDDEGREFMTGLLCGELQQKFFHNGTDDDHLAHLKKLPIPVGAKEKIRKIATFHFLNVAFEDLSNGHFCHATFTRMNAEERAASATQVAIAEAKRKKPWEENEKG